MGNTSIKHTPLGQSLIGYTFKTKSDLYYKYCDYEKCYYLDTIGYDKLLNHPITFKVVDIYINKGLGDYSLYIELQIDNNDFFGKIKANPEDIGFTIPQKHRDKELYFYDRHNTFSIDNEQYIHYKGNVLELIEI